MAKCKGGKCGGYRRIIPTDAYFDIDLMIAVEDEGKVYGKKLTTIGTRDGFTVKCKRDRLLQVSITQCDEEDKRSDSVVKVYRCCGPDKVVVIERVRRKDVVLMRKQHQVVTLLARKIAAKL